MSGTARNEVITEPPCQSRALRQRRDERSRGIRRARPKVLEISGPPPTRSGRTPDETAHGSGAVPSQAGRAMSRVDARVLFRWFAKDSASGSRLSSARNRVSNAAGRASMSLAAPTPWGVEIPAATPLFDCRTARRIRHFDATGGPAPREWPRRDRGRWQRPCLMGVSSDCQSDRAEVTRVPERRARSPPQPHRWSSVSLARRGPTSRRLTADGRAGSARRAVASGTPRRFRGRADSASTRARDTSVRRVVDPGARPGRI
jgi:hypothetical protein